MGSDAVKWLAPLSRAGSVNCVGMLEFCWPGFKAYMMKQSRSSQRLACSCVTAPLSISARETFGHKDHFWAKHCLSRAAALYHDWNATARVKSLPEEFDSIRLENDKSYDGFNCSFRARSRTRPWINPLIPFNLCRSGFLVIQKERSRIVCESLGNAKSTPIFE